MNHTALLRGKLFHFVETLPVYAADQTLILCEAEDGTRLLCAAADWQAAAELTALQLAHSLPALPPVPAEESDSSADSSSSEPAAAPQASEQSVPSLSTTSPAVDKIAFFQSLFHGRSDVYAKRYYNLKTQQSGYVPACGNEWQRGLCEKPKVKCALCPNRALLPLSFSVIKRHLLGRDGFCRDVAGIYPLQPDDSTFLLVTDFDEAAWQKDVTAFRTLCAKYQIPVAVERSRSGNGAHVWFFFSDAVPAVKARRLASGLLTRTMQMRHELKLSSYDRLIPNQDTQPKGGFGNLIALPFQGRAQAEGNSLFVDEAFAPYPDQWAYLSALPRITPAELDALLQSVCGANELGELLPAEDFPTSDNISTLSSSRKTPLAPREEANGQTTFAPPEPSAHQRLRKKPLSAVDFPAVVKLTLADGLYMEKSGLS